MTQECHLQNPIVTALAHIFKFLGRGKVRCYNILILSQYKVGLAVTIMYEGLLNIRKHLAVIIRVDN